MIVSLFANPGQSLKLVVEVLNANDERADGYEDGYSAPIISSFYLKDGSRVAGFPKSMTHLETGVYVLGVTLPSGLSGVGTFIANALWDQPGTGLNRSAVFIINSALPFGNSTLNPF